MCRSGHTLSQCLGISGLQEEFAAEPTYGFGAGYLHQQQQQQQQQQQRMAKHQNRNTRKFARRRRSFAAFTAIMGRLGRTAPLISSRPLFKVHYRKLDEDLSPVKQSRREEKNSVVKSRQIKIVSPIVQDYMTSCCRCGHTQKLKVSFFFWVSYFFINVGHIFLRF